MDDSSPDSALTLPDTPLPVAEKRLPERILKAIAAHDNSSETLVRLLQLLVVAVFGALYALSPRPVDVVTFSPVPYVLAAYAVFTLAGLALVLRMRLPDAAVYVMTFIDIALLMVLIWSFHIQYGQPPSFYLKAPTLLYIFIFIALRALRFEARFVIAAGLAAVLGWLALVSYAVLADPAHMMVTRDFVTYLTTNSILIGAELDKAIVIVSVTLILALAVRRGRGLLIEAVSEQAAAQELSRFFDPDVAGRIRSAGQPIAAGEGMVREAAILNIDIRGFTALSEKMTPQALMQLLSAYQDRLVPIVRAHGGAIDKFMGDGIMASFGAAHPTATYAADALNALDDAIAALDTWSEGLPAGLDPASINMAVADGRVIFGAVGSGDRLEFTVIGEPVNLCAKLEKCNKTAGSRALATARVYASAREQGYQPGRGIETVSLAIDGTDGKTPVVRLY